MSKKLQPRFVGPYSIIALDGVNATISLSDKSTPFVVHQNDIKPFLEKQTDATASFPPNSIDSDEINIIPSKPSPDTLDSTIVSCIPSRGVVDGEDLTDPKTPPRRHGLRKHPKPSVRFDI